MLIAFVDTVKLCLKLWVGNIFIVHIMKVVHLSLRKTFNEALKRERERERERKRESLTIHENNTKKKGNDLIEMF